MKVISPVVRVGVGVAIVCGILAGGAWGAAPGKISVDLDHPGPKVGPLFYGLMTEEINHSYDGGLYAELIQNRIFKDDHDKPVHWSVVQGGGSAGTITLDNKNPVNNNALTTSLRLDVSAAEKGQPVGVANDGYWGIPVWPGTKYRASFYARAADGFSGPLHVAIVSTDGSKTLASADVPSVGTEWKKYEASLSTAADAPKSTANRFVITAESKGSVWFSLVSLFPPTYHDRPNGNRIDLMEKLAEMHPAFLRFPGGNFLEGNTVAERFDWKKTIGPLEQRPGHQGCWKYRASDGLGLLEFLEWCEDLHMEPLLAVYAGYSLHGEFVQPGKDLLPFIQEDLDEIEYVTGDAATTKWGKERAKDGHPQPFPLRFVEIGNEDWFDKSGTYDGRFAQIFDAIKAKYPNLKCICTTPVTSRTPDLIDDHAYPSPKQMQQTVHRYDKYDPKKPKVFFGEWAAQDGRPTPTMRAALADAAWLTGLQQDADVVLMNCYAPLLVNVNKDAWQWPTNLIGYDAATSFGSPSYYAQAMFSRAWGDTVLPTTVVAQEVQLPPEPEPQGFIGVGTWRTSAEFKDVTVTRGADTLYKSDFAPGSMQGWKPYGSGKWVVRDGAMQQTEQGREGARATTGDGSWQDYTISLKARKLGGDEGFLILFHVKDRNNFLWFNVGGWKNTRCGIEKAADSPKTEELKTTPAQAPFTVDAGRWYDLRVELKGRDIKGYVDDKLMVEATDTPVPPAPNFFALASRDGSSGEVILKVVNCAQVAEQAEVRLQGAADVAKEATVELLSGQPGDVNTLEEPTKVAPKQGRISDAGPSFVHEFPASSVSVIRLKAKPGTSAAK